MRRRRRDRGAIALILALMVLIVLALVVTQMSSTSVHNRTVAENYLADLQNTYGTRSGYAHARLLLEADLEAGAQVDTLHERWAAPLSIEVGRAQVEVSIRDAERALNLSALVNDKGEPNAPVVAALRRLVALLGHPVDVAERIVDYVDADGRGGFETRARNRRLMDVDELLRIEGLGPEVLYGVPEGEENPRGLLEYVTVWPVQATWSVNVNTAPPEVLRALSDEMTAPVAAAIAAWRAGRDSDGRPREFRAVEDVKQVPGMTDEIFASIQGSLAVRSSVFEVRVRSRVGRVEKGWLYVVRRTAASGDRAGSLKLLAARRMNDLVTARPPEEGR
jgi:type II secretory pathway component PulK